MSRTGRSPDASASKRPLNAVNRRAAAPCAAIILVAAMLLGLPGCGGEPRTADEVKSEYTRKLLQGHTVGYAEIRADRADPQTYELFDIRIEDGERIIHADRGRVVVNAETGEISLRLSGVVGADSESGALVSFDDLRTGGAKLPYRIVAESEREQ